jgi:RNA polymerase sigma-70 factor (ECF subfamily)
MISTQARGVWQELDAKLRPYIARRVPVEIDPSDILQDIFIRLHHGQDSLRDEDSFGGWVYRIAQHAIADHLRKYRREPTAVVELSHEASELADENDLAPELAQCVAVFVARLPSPYREAVTLTELNGLTHKRAAEILSVPLSTMKSRVARGRQRIRSMFDECCVMSVDSRGRVTQCDARALSEVPSDCRDMAIEWSARQQSPVRS